MNETLASLARIARRHLSFAARRPRRLARSADIGQDRDSVADERDRRADERDSEATRRDQAADRRDSSLGDLLDNATSRDQAADERDRAAEIRDAAADLRIEIHATGLKSTVLEHAQHCVGGQIDIRRELIRVPAVLRIARHGFSRLTIAAPAL